MEIAGYGWNTGSGYRIIPEFSSLTKISVSGQEIMGFNRGTLLVFHSLEGARPPQ
jgi:hypothetical protein